jgi:hypothetical protein
MLPTCRHGLDPIVVQVMCAVLVTPCAHIDKQRVLEAGGLPTGLPETSVPLCHHDGVYIHGPGLHTPHGIRHFRVLMLSLNCHMVCIFKRASLGSHMDVDDDTTAFYDGLRSSVF